MDFYVFKMKFKIIIFLFLIIYPSTAYSKFETVKHTFKMKFKIETNINNIKKFKSTWIELEGTNKGFFEKNNDFENCQTSGVQIFSRKISKKKIRKQLGFFDCKKQTQIDDPRIAGQTTLREGISYTYLAHPETLDSEKLDFLKHGLINKKQKNPILFADIYIQKDKKTYYGFYIFKSEVYSRAYNDYVNVAFSVYKRRRAESGNNFYKMTKSKHFELKDIDKQNVKKLYDKLLTVEKHFEKFEKKKYKIKELDPEVKRYLLSLTPNSEWKFITRADAD